MEFREPPVAGINRRIGLNNAPDGAVAGGLNFPVQGAYYAHCQRGIQTKGVADGHDFPADRELRRITNRKFHQSSRRVNHAQDCEVTLWRQAYTLGLKSILVCQCDG